MTVQELIDQLSSIKDKNKTIAFVHPGLEDLHVWPVACAWEYDFEGEHIVLLDRQRLSLGAMK